MEKMKFHKSINITFDEAMNKSTTSNGESI